MMGYCYVGLDTHEIIFVASKSAVVNKPIFHLATLFARREMKTRIRQRDWLKLGVGSVLVFCVFARTNSPSGK